MNDLLEGLPDTARDKLQETGQPGRGKIPGRG
jgi:hypothetical protein